MRANNNYQKPRRWRQKVSGEKNKTENDHNKRAFSAEKSKLCFEHNYSMIDWMTFGNEKSFSSEWKRRFKTCLFVDTTNRIGGVEAEEVRRVFSFPWESWRWQLLFCARMHISHKKRTGEAARKLTVIVVKKKSDGYPCRSTRKVLGFDILLLCQGSFFLMLCTSNAAVYPCLSFVYKARAGALLLEFSSQFFPSACFWAVKYFVQYRLLSPILQGVFFF